MKHISLIMLAAILLAACNLPDSFLYSGDLRVGEVTEGTLERESPDTFYFDFSADTYLCGVCNQVSVDVVVTLYDSAGTALGLFDGPSSGPEDFFFEVRKPGRYMLEVAPFKKGAGSYTIELKVVEPIATVPAKRADQLFYPYSGEEVPGGVAGVMQHGKVVFNKAYGMANLTYHVPYATGTPGNIGSVSKQFTATAILLLEQQGKLSLDDDVRKYIPELPDLGEVVTLRHMLNHTSGFREVYNLMAMTGWHFEDALRRDEVIEILKRQKELQAPPGEEFNYNNSAFILLATIVERISGLPFPEFMKENLFAPLGMTSTMVRTDPGTIVPGASQGYTQDSTGGYGETGDLCASYGAGGIYSTVDDFNAWMRNFSHPVVGNEELVTRLVTVDTLNNGDTMTYALGIEVGEHRGLKTYSHGGADLAHRAFMVYFPEIEAGVVTMSNNASFPSDRIAYNLADVFFGDEMEPQEEEGVDAGGKDSTGVEIPKEVLAAYAGEYMMKGIGLVMKFSVVDGALKMTIEGQPEAMMIPQSKTRFKYEGVDAYIEFRSGEEGNVTGAVHYQGGQEFEMERLAPYEPSMDDLLALEGRYLSDELETFYTLEVRDSTLTLLIRNAGEVRLSPVKKDLYKGDVFFISELAFLRDGAGRVTGFSVSSGRTKGIGFEKL
jgi:CubicO group peptidase (beta-lactamase class C family)